VQEPILDSDIVSRSYFFPRDYREEGILDLSRCLCFQEGNSYKESVNCNRLLGDSEEAIHNLGLKKQLDDQMAGRPDKVYKGYGEARVGDIRAINVNESRVIVYHEFENGNSAHCTLQIRWCNDNKNKNVRSVIRQRVSDCFKRTVNYSPPATS
jgi:hypothetical protein